MTPRLTRLQLVLGLCLAGWTMVAPRVGLGAQVVAPDGKVLERFQRDAFRFFVEQTHPVTGLTYDRAPNSGKPPAGPRVASIAATGYQLAALPVGVERKWMGRREAMVRATRALRFALSMENQHGWLYHFIDGQTGKRVWNCEVSTIDTCLMVQGALVCGGYFGGTEVERLADRLYDRLDWDWVRTDGGAQPGRLTVSHGWSPERGFIPNQWGSYCEHMLLYLLGMGARKRPLPPASWGAWQRPLFIYNGLECLAGGPLFFHQMSHAFYDFEGRRDRLGFDYQVSAVNAVRSHIAFCRANAARRRSYADGWWGLNACDCPDGYNAFGLPAPEDGTICPTAVLAAVHEQPGQVMATVRAMCDRLGGRALGRYGFADAFNIDRSWFGPDVLGIDLGMALLAIENHRSGLIHRLNMAQPYAIRAMAAAGLRRTSEPEPRPLRQPVP